MPSSLRRHSESAHDERKHRRAHFSASRVESSAVDHARPIRLPPFRLPAPHEPASPVVAVTAIRLIPPVQTPRARRAHLAFRRITNAGTHIVPYRVNPGTRPKSSSALARCTRPWSRMTAITSASPLSSSACWLIAAAPETWCTWTGKTWMPKRGISSTARRNWLSRAIFAWCCWRRWAIPSWASRSE